MRTRFSEIWTTLTSGLWFLPSIMVVGSFVLAISTLWLDDQYGFEFQSGLGLIYASSVDGGRELLSTIAGSMMTVTGVVFSITIVTLSLTSNQYGPRLLRNFLRDRGNQFVLGTFLSTFTYSLVILRTLQDSGEDATVPELSITIGALLALVSLGVLIYFIHHISQAIQASSILSGVGTELSGSIDTLFPERIGSSEKAQPPQDQQAAPDLATAQLSVVSEKTGYVRAIDPASLVSAAVSCNAIIHLDVKPGQYVFRNGRLARAWVASDNREALDDDIRDAIVIGRSRTPFQDIDFLMSQLVQSALLALSSGVNNSIVAIEAIDWIGASLARIAERELPETHRYDDDGNLRVIAHPATFVSLLEESYNPLRESARSNTLVTIHLLETLAKIEPHAYRQQDRQAIFEQGRLLHQAGRDAADSEYDRQRIASAFRSLGAIPT